MSEGSPWKSSASSKLKLSSLKGYLAQQDLNLNGAQAYIQRQIGVGREKAGGWKEWAGQKINNYNVSQVSLGTDKVVLFPGWAARRYVNAKGEVPGKRKKEEEPFQVDVFVSGYATAHRPPDSATRSQRAFLRLAKGFAALPKLEGPGGSGGGQQEQEQEQDDSTLAVLMGAGQAHAIRPSRSTEELLRSVQLPPRPNEVGEDYEVEALERHFHDMKAAGSANRRQDSDSMGTLGSSPSRSWSFDTDDTVPIKSAPPTVPNTRSVTPTNITQTTTAAVSDELRKLHANLESRLQPFWSSVLSNRTVRISLFASPQQQQQQQQQHGNHGPVECREVITGPDGSFQARFRLFWNDLCRHPEALHIAFGEPTEEHDFIVVAELLPALLPAPPNSSVGFSERGDAKPTTTTRTTSATIRVPLTHSPVRLISDVDDTIKYSNVSGGARAVFRNVFVKELKDLVIPGMGEWYSEMWRKGVRFHYVSNGPFEMLPVIGEFFEVSKLPPGSVKLRSYAGKSLFSGLLSAPSARKRSGVLDIMDGFPDSKFILVGDSGEQDLELYADLAREKPEQILGIFIRDTTIGDPLDDPTGDQFQYGGVPPPISYSGVPSPLTPDIPEGQQATRWPVMDQPGPKAKPVLRRPVTTRLSLPEEEGKELESRKTPVSAGPRVYGGRGEYFTSSLVTTEPEPLVEYDGMSVGVGMGMGTTPSTAASASASAGGGITPVTPAYSYPYAYSTYSGASTPKTAPPLTSPPLRTGVSNGSFVSVKTGGGSTTNTDAGTSVNAGAGAGVGTPARMLEVERKRYELQMRVYRARAGVPMHVVLRVFREPRECVESWSLLGRYFR